MRAPAGHEVYLDPRCSSLVPPTLRGSVPWTVCVITKPSQYLAVVSLLLVTSRDPGSKSKVTPVLQMGATQAPRYRPPSGRGLEGKPFLR